MKSIQPIIILLLILLFTGCENNKKTSSTQIDDVGILADSVKEKVIKKVFFNMPSPIELTQILSSVNSSFNPQLLNPISKLEQYTTTSKLALNFGIYGADLCYCRVYDQLQESISYLSAVRKISEKLQIPEDEGTKTIKKIEESINDRDLMFAIIADTYANADGYLKENERDLTATFILIGGWIEGMYFSVNINKESKNKLSENIAEQKFALQNLMQLINNYSNDKAIEELNPLFKELKTVYDSIDISYDSQIVITDQEDKSTTIDNVSNVKITQQQLDDIYNIIVKIRNVIID
jgi:hypothetical protein